MDDTIAALHVGGRDLGIGGSNVPDFEAILVALGDDQREVLAAEVGGGEGGLGVVDAVLEVRGLELGCGEEVELKSSLDVGNRGRLQKPRLDASVAWSEQSGGLDAFEVAENVAEGRIVEKLSSSKESDVEVSDPTASRHIIVGLGY
jgi:hypothetical protein